LVKAVPHLAMVDELPANSGAALTQKALGKAGFKSAIADHYLTNPIARASQLMAELSANAKARNAAALAAE